MDEFDQLIGGIGDEIDARFAGADGLPAEVPESLASTAAAPIEQQAVPDAAPPLESTDPSPQQPINWDAPDNPYRQKAEWGTDVINKLHQQAVYQQQVQAQQQDYADQQALVALQQELPNLEPEQQQFVMQNLLAWQQQKHQQELASLQNRYEPHVQKLVINDLGDKLSLTAEERAELQQIRDPRLAVWMAKTRSDARKSADAQVAAARQELENLKLNQAAMGRRQSGVLGIPGTSSGGAIVDPSEATNIDDFIRGLNLFQRAG